MKEKTPSDYIMEVYRRKQTLSTLKQPLNNVNVINIASKHIKHDVEGTNFFEEQTMTVLFRSLCSSYATYGLSNPNPNPTSNLRGNRGNRYNGKTRLRKKMRSP